MLDKSVYPDTPFDTIIYYRKLAQFYADLAENRTTDLITVVPELEYVFIPCSDIPHEFYEDNYGMRCINCGEYNTIEQLDITLPDEIMSKILRSNSKLLHASVATSKSIREYSIEHFIKNSTILTREYTKEEMNLTLYMVCMAGGYIRYRIKDMVGSNTICGYYTPELEDKDISKILINERSLRNIYTNRLSSLVFGKKLTSIVDNKVDEILEDTRALLPGNLFLYYQVMNNYVYEEDNLDPAIILKYIKDNKI